MASEKLEAKRLKDILDTISKPGGLADDPFLHSVVWRIIATSTLTSDLLRAASRRNLLPDGDQSICQPVNIAYERDETGEPLGV